MRLLPILIILAAFYANAQNSVKLVQYTDIEACEGDGTGNITVGVEIGSINPQDNFQGYEIAVSYKDQPLKGMMPVLTANSLTSQIPSQYVAFGNDSQNSEIFGSAFLITSGNTGISGSRPLVGFRIEDNSECFEKAELKITQFFVNEECTIDFSVDSTLIITKGYDEDLITELTVSSMIRDSILNNETTHTSIEYILDGNYLGLSVDTLRMTLAEYDSLESEIEIFGEYQQKIVTEETTVLVDYKFPSDGIIARRELSTKSNFESNDTLEINGQFAASTICDCVRLSSEITDLVYIEKNQTNIGVENQDGKKIKVYYQNGLVIENYIGDVHIAEISGRHTLHNYVKQPIKLDSGMYIIIIPGHKTEKILISNF